MTNPQNTKPNPNDLFWLARYAHLTLSPLMESVAGNLKISIAFDGPFPGVDVWVHHNDKAKDGVVGYRICMNSKAAVDGFAVKLQTNASVTV